MKKSAAVVLVISGSLLMGCNDQSRNDPDYYTRTNNTYQPGPGYWHAPYHGWYRYPFNYYDPSRGYFRGGDWSSQPEDQTARSTSSGGGYSGSHSSGGFFGHGSASVSRGGFGSIGHGGGGGE